MTTVIQLDKDKYHLQSEMEKWCSNNISKNPPYRNWVGGEPKSWEGLGTWCMSSMFGSTFFYFKEEKDALWFELAWT